MRFIRKNIKELVQRKIYYYFYRKEGYRKSGYKLYKKLCLFVFVILKIKYIYISNRK